MQDVKVLVVEDDAVALAIIDEILTGLGIEYDVATCLVEAKRLLKTNGYCLVLLDGEIPIRRGGVARIQNTENFLEALAEAKPEGMPPVIILLPPDEECPMNREEAIRWASGVSRKGATDFIAKPFAKGGRTLDRVIKKVLGTKPMAPKVELPVEAEPACDVGIEGRCPKPSQPSAEPVVEEKEPHPEPHRGKPRPFAGGEMLFYPDHTELCGVEFLGAAATASRDMLGALAKPGTHGERRGLSGEQVKRKIGAQTVGTVTGAARTIRRKATECMKGELNLECGPQDVLENDGRHGYRLKDWITVRWVGERGSM